MLEYIVMLLYQNTIITFITMNQLIMEYLYL